MSNVSNNHQKCIKSFKYFKYVTSITEKVMPEMVTSEDIFSILSDRISSSILKSAYSGLRASSTNYIGKISKKQFYVRLKRLREAGLIEKRDSFYRTTTLGSLIYNGHIKTLDEALSNFWQLKAIDLLKTRKDFPSHQKEIVINEIIRGSNLKDIVNSTHLSGFTVVKDFNRLIVEAIRLLENARKEIYFATRYHDPHVSSKTFEKFAKGATLHILDSNPEPISVENRINAILRTPPNRQTFELVNDMIKSSRFDLKQITTLPASFLVVDGTQVLYETTNYFNPEQFTVALAHYDDVYLAEQFIKYFKLLSKDAISPKLLQRVRE
jgi:DNA-binding transcriptional ArsR family regulator